MKKIALLGLVALLTGSMNAQISSSSGPSLSTTTSTNPLSVNFEKKLTVTEEIKNGLKIPHKGDEHVIIKSDGGFYKSWPNDMNGSWTYQASDNSVTLTVGSNSQKFTIDESTKYQVKISKANHSYTFVPEGAPTQHNGGATVAPKVTGPSLKGKVKK